MTLLRPARSVRPLGLAFLLALAGVADAQTVRAKLVPPQPLAFSNFGRGLDWTPGWAFAAVPGHGSFGAVYVYAEIGDDWFFHQVLTTPIPPSGDKLGWTLAASGDWMVATSPFAANSGGASGGLAYVFQQVSGTWIYRQTLEPSDAAQPGSQLFGTSVDIDGSTLVVGNFADNAPLTNGGGSAHVFELSGSTWVETAKLVPATPQDLEFDALFGSAVAVHGDRLVVGAEAHDNGLPGSNRGAVFVFQRLQGAWIQVQKLQADDPLGMDHFGSSLALQGDTLLVGSEGHAHPGAGGNLGAVYAFSSSAGVWSQDQELAPPAPGDPTLFGSGLDLEDNVAVIGSLRDSDLGLDSGCAYLFRKSDAQWQFFGKALAPQAEDQDWLGSLVRIRGTRILVAAMGDDDLCGGSGSCDAGAAYVFDIAPRTAQYGSCLALGPCGNSDDHGGCQNSAGQGAVLAAGGSTSVAADSLILEARWLPPQVLGLLYMGGGTNALPFGDGLQVVGSGSKGVYRLLPPQSSAAAGVMRWDGGLVALSQSNPPAGQIQAGDTWYMQVWYRDPTGPCGSSFNTTNGLKVEFKP